MAVERPGRRRTEKITNHSPLIRGHDGDPLAPSSGRIGQTRPRFEGRISLMIAMTERESAPFTTVPGPLSLGRLQVQKIAVLPSAMKPCTFLRAKKPRLALRSASSRRPRRRWSPDGGKDSFTARKRSRAGGSSFTVL